MIETFIQYNLTYPKNFQILPEAFRQLPDALVSKGTVI